jgi:aminoglycoside phosphotransferase (APT) family kinase protein
MMTTRRAPSVRQQMLDPTFSLRLGKAFPDGLTVMGLRVRPMRRRPGSRHVFSCDLSLGDQRTGTRSSIELIGKRDNRGAAGKAAREFEAMRLLWDAGFGLDEQFKIPRPVQHFPDLQVILQGKARGTKLRAYLGKANCAPLSYARMAGLWLAKLHNLKASSPQACLYGSEIASLRMFVAALTEDQPKLAPEIQERAAALERSFASFQNVRAAMVHGDFHPDHIFVCRDAVTVIDFERFCLGDPARDLGSFIAHVRTMTCFCGRPMDSADPEIDAFLRSYLSTLPLIEATAIAARIAPHAALAGLEALYYVASVLKIVDASRLALYVNCMRESELRAAQFAALPAGGNPTGWMERFPRRKG